MTRGLLIVAALLPAGAALAAGCGSFVVTQPYHPPQAAASARDKAAEAAKPDARVETKPAPRGREH